jgi:GAF domain-containing protein
MAMTDELSQTEVSRKLSASPQANLVGILDAARRVHAASDETGVASAAGEAVAALLGSSPATVQIKQEKPGQARSTLTPTAEIPKDPSQRLNALMDRAAAQGLPVVDDQPPGGAALPIQNEARTFGALYVAHPDLRRVIAGGDWEILKLLVSHVATALTNLGRRLPAPDASLVADLVPNNLSLHDAKLAFERRLLFLRLAEARGNVAAAARALDMDRGQLSRLMRKHQLDRSSFRPAKP